MELTTDEQKILDAANDSSKCNRQNASNVMLAFMIVGAIGAGGIIVDRVIELISGNRKALGTISFGLVLIAFLGVVYQFSKFRDAALKLVSKLQRESNKA